MTGKGENMKNSLSLISLGAAAFILAACETTPPVTNAINMRPDGNGGFTGVAGSTWTEAEIAAKAAENFCGGSTPSQISIQEAADGTKEISGTC